MRLTAPQMIGQPRKPRPLQAPRFGSYENRQQQSVGDKARGWFYLFKQQRFDFHKLLGGQLADGWTNGQKMLEFLSATPSPFSPEVIKAATSGDDGPKILSKLEDQGIISFGPCGYFLTGFAQTMTSTPDRIGEDLMEVLDKTYLYHDTPRQKQAPQTGARILELFHKADEINDQRQKLGDHRELPDMAPAQIVKACYGINNSRNFDPLKDWGLLKAGRHGLELSAFGEAILEAYQQVSPSQ